MKLLYLLKRDIDSTLQDFIDVHRKSHEVTIIDVREEKDYDRIIDVIFSTDRVISW